MSIVASVVITDSVNWWMPRTGTRTGRVRPRCHLGVALGLLMSVAEAADGHRAAMSDCLQGKGFAVLK